jgi:hypothetical protein
MQLIVAMLRRGANLHAPEGICVPQEQVCRSKNLIGTEFGTAYAGETIG